METLPNTAHESLDDTPNPWDALKTVPMAESDSKPDLPTTSENSTCRSLLRFIKRDGRLPDIQNFLKQTATRASLDLTSPEKLADFQSSYTVAAHSSLSSEEKSALKSYTGFDYKLINQVARGHWNYDSLGTQTPEKVAKAESTIAQIEQAIAHAPDVGADLTTYRGTNLDSFYSYGINELSDLSKLKNQFYLERGFTSTSLLPTNSFVNREFDDPLRRHCNIEVEYHIPAESHDGVALLSEELSYNPEQNEYLLNDFSLSYVTDVKVDETAGTAHLKMALIPRNVYERAPEEHQNNEG